MGMGKICMNQMLFGDAMFIFPCEAKKMLLKKESLPNRTSFIMIEYVFVRCSIIFYFNCFLVIVLDQKIIVGTSACFVLLNKEYCFVFVLSFKF